MNTKRCTQCKEIKDVKQFYTDMRALDLCRSECIECFSTSSKANYVKIAAKKCSSCKEKKLINQFYKNCSAKDGLTAKCIVCYKAYQKKYMSSEKYKARAATYHRWYRRVQRDGKEKHPRENNKRKKLPLELIELQEKYRNLFKIVHNRD
jgi:hypothetical protein